MKNDILLFAVMFAVAWMGYNFAKDRLQPAATEVVESKAVTSDDEQANSVAASKANELASTFNNKTAEMEIEQVLIEQSRAWNRGDLSGFMRHYWDSEDLTFSRDGETTLGWGATYSHFQERYPDGEMGKIDFMDLKTETVGKEAAIITGRFDHQLAAGKVNGSFSLVVKLFDGQWKIVNDTTTVAK